MSDMKYLPLKRRNHCKQHQAMSDGSATGQFPRRPFFIDMDPEIVTGDTREIRDTILADFNPVTHAERLAHKVDKVRW